MDTDSEVYVVIDGIQYAWIFDIVNGELVERLFPLWEVNDGFR